MRIKLAMLECDSAYLRRVVTMFNSKYAQEIEVYSFTEQDAAIMCLEEKRIDVFLSSDNFKIDLTKIPARCGFAYLVESLDINTIDNCKAICKYQKGELLYKQILSIYSEHIPNVSGGINKDDSTMKTIAFCSPCGGVGTSTTAAACAIYLTNAGHRVMYLNLEIFGDSETYFACDGQFDFSDIVYAIKSNKTNRAMKLQSTVKQDQCGVYYYSSAKIPLDIMEMSVEDFATLHNEIKALGCYDYVVMDIDFPRNHKDFKVFDLCNSIVVVSDGSDISQRKVSKALLAVQILEQQEDNVIQPRMWILKNKVSSHELFQNEIRYLGNIPLYQSVAPAQIAKQIAISNVYQQLM